MEIAKFIKLKPGEDVIATVHGYGISFAWWIVLFFFWIVIPFFFLFPLFRQGIVGVVIFLLLVLSGVFMSWRKWFLWNQTIFIITNIRIVDVDQRGFFDRIISEVNLNEISDVTFRVRGIIPTIFRYGAVRVETKEEVLNIEIHRVKNPSKIHNLLNDLRRGSSINPNVKKQEKINKIMQSLTTEEIDKIANKIALNEQEEGLSELHE